AAGRAGIKETGRPDIALLVAESPCAAAGVYSHNAVRAYCVDWNEQHLPSPNIRALLVNSGNANACTGAQGIDDAQRVIKETASVCGIEDDSVLIASTGVIGRVLPMDSIMQAIPALPSAAAPTPRAANHFARAIMTTDTRPKEYACKVTVGEHTYTIGGCAKGSGMIHPNMATLLAFVTTDAVVSPSVLQSLLKRVVDRTFNNLTIDGDSSTNDMTLVLASGASGVRIRTTEDKKLFEQALYEVCNDLCAQLAADGEGCSKRIEVQVRGAKTLQDARSAARTIASSNLVKTAMFGNDPNWGRIACAIGRSGVRFSREKMHIAIGDFPVCIGLQPWPFPHKQMQHALRRKVVRISVDLGLGNHTATAHTCDLTYDYIRINADYTT
ncbi:MAG: bifunctional glutamate N-acetyltransferase/amino-acid acetyltransferase ArgJ, partial [Chitinivibrionales bacterium]|nr:bifunctional glutamate N-acetyltransferase/amino-acid acetyltransferase ArgJ [Chitinivibrionales bacterium]